MDFVEIVRVIADWILIATSTYVVLRSVDRLIMRPNSSLGNYVILVTWIFCCLPIALDYLIGRPEYQTVYWYAPFIAPMANSEVSLVYDALMFASIYALYFYCNSHDREGVNASFKPLAWSTPLGNHGIVLALTIVSPFIYIVISGLWRYFLTYGDSGTRGMPAGSNTMVTMLLLLSVMAFCTGFFRKEQIKTSDVLLGCIYSGAVIWVSGKRFMIALLAILYVFFFLNRGISARIRKRLKFILPVLLCVLFGFSAFYLVGVRPLSDTSAASVYEMLRVDFGRDDVTKYVIYHEFFLGDHILDYPGETFLSTFFIWIPRVIWTAKPFNHYQYLTSSILGLPISSLPAGTTPSWWEMSIANFSIVGLFVAVLGLVAIVAIADRAKAVTTRATALVLLIALMTQSVDAYLSLVMLLVVQYGLSIFILKKNQRSSVSEANSSVNLKRVA